MRHRTLIIIGLLFLALSLTLAACGRWRGTRTRLTHPSPGAPQDTPARTGRMPRTGTLPGAGNAGHGHSLRGTVGNLTPR
jgi:hypothetical protein